MTAPTTATEPVVLAAIGGTSMAPLVLETAAKLGELIGATVEAVHVDEGPADTTGTLAATFGVSVRRLRGPVASTLLAATESPNVLVAVIGGHGPASDDGPVGPTARHILEHTTRPALVVPPDVRLPTVIRRCLVPLEGTEPSSRPVLQALGRLLRNEVELVVLHVFTDETLPRMLDRPYQDMELLGQEFLITHCPPAGAIEMRRGPVASRVVEVSEEREADLIVLSWSQVGEEGRARVVRDVLGASDRPVLLLPVTDGGADR
jgi:nucleotide-binding universal stress UspA family protein